MYQDTNAYVMSSRWKKPATNPPAEAEVEYGDRAEHCWNGDHTRPNALSRLRYHQMFVPRILDRMRRSLVPPGADTLSWRG